MSKITISNLNNKQVVGHNNSKTVLNIMHENFVDWMHACGGKGRCTTCKMKILEGREHLSELSDFEEKMRRVRRWEPMRDWLVNALSGVILLSKYPKRPNSRM